MFKATCKTFLRKKNGRRVVVLGEESIGMVCFLYWPFVSVPPQTHYSADMVVILILPA